MAVQEARPVSLVRPEAAEPAAHWQAASQARVLLEVRAAQAARASLEGLLVQISAHQRLLRATHAVRLSSLEGMGPSERPEVRVVMAAPAVREGQGLAAMRQMAHWVEMVAPVGMLLVAVSSDKTQE